MTKLVHGLCYLLLTSYMVCLAFTACQLAFFNSHDGGNLPIGAPPLLYSSKNWLCRACSLSVFVVLLLVSAALWSVSASDTRPAKHCYLTHFAAILFTTS
jgi:hypothetical protein